jgi:hypothetical protein
LRLQPGGVTCRPRLFREREAAAVTEQEFRQAMAGTQEIDANVFAAAEQIARGLLLFGRNVDRSERVRAVEDRQLGRIATIGFDAIPGAPGNQRGAMTSHGMSWAVSARCNSKPHGPAS